MNYLDIYNLRLNRYGLNSQERIQGKREHEFELYLAKSVYRVTFEYNGQQIVGSLEKKSQNETKILQSLLVPRDVDIPNGTVLEILDKNQDKQYWLVYYLEEIKASGYNKYTVIKMTCSFTWTQDGVTHSARAYLYGQEDNMLKDELKSRSRMDTLYTENLKASFLIMERNQYIKKDTYLVIGDEPYQQSFRVTGFDIVSTPGVEYVTIDPIYTYDLTPPPEQTPQDNPEDFYWIKGGLTQ